MGMSTDGQLSYGILLPEGDEFEWDIEPFNGEFDEWYLKKVTDFESKTGNYWKDFYDYLGDNPIPFEIIFHCTYDYPMQILALKGKHWYNTRGYPEKINPDDMYITEEEIQSLVDFVNENLAEHFEDVESLPIGWWLTSMYG